MKLILLGLRHFVYDLVGRVSKEPAKPLVIVGTGRCGTTLLYRIMQSHPDITAFPTEANELWHPHSYPYSRRTIETPPMMADPETFTNRSLEHWPRGHGARIKRIFAGCLALGRGRQFLVKSAMISHMMPDIRKLFPEARFIHIYRSGPSVVESWLKKEWSKYEDMVDDAQELRRQRAGYWNTCLQTIEHARQTLKLDEQDAYMELAYEALCDNPEAELRRIAAFAYLDFEKFTFDITTIRSTNTKVGDYSQDPKWTELVEIMRPMMTAKAYLTDAPAAQHERPS